MSAWTLRAVTESAWLLERDGVRHSMVVFNGESYKVIGPLEKKVFASLDDLDSMLGGGIKMENRDADGDAGDEIGQVDGYPIKHASAFDIELGEIVTYAKAHKSKVRFAAGYYAIDFDHGWTASYCPRLDTLHNHGYIGPFRSKLEMQNAISAKKREISI